MLVTERGTGDIRRILPELHFLEGPIAVYSTLITIIENSRTPFCGGVGWVGLKFSEADHSG
jgi:hypothetical protein